MTIFLLLLITIISCAKPEVKYIYETKYIVPDIIQLEKIERPKLEPVIVIRNNQTNQWCMDEDNMTNFILNKRMYERTIDKCIDILKVYQEFYNEYYQKKFEIQSGSNSSDK